MSVIQKKLRETRSHRSGQEHGRQSTVNFAGHRDVELE
jgi:hypothetical protein